MNHKDQYVTLSGSEIWDQVDDIPPSRNRRLAVRLGFCGAVALAICLFAMSPAGDRLSAPIAASVNQRLIREFRVGDEPLLGGLGDTHPITPEVAEMVNGLKSRIIAKAQAQGLNSIGAEFEPISYRSQVVAGTNYFVKVRVGRNEYLHVRIFKPLPYTHEEPQVVSVQVGKRDRDRIDWVV
eukprot:EG_transcript_19656